ncbi:DUF349 domain-containing protein [Alteromonas sp. ASW11-130]|uniref:DUF349 domain-containing protein n=1 Tax=Alteromonas sp. ASW11-130 TaxID=3015775 RepID=UPI002242433F|nr:DUF349 domain-containing protein [Alteromonas sp. ASW11-130]MCW8092085.1 DUF349 domain-containing protein [Alteromonas sp. ASW11-130]
MIFKRFFSSSHKSNSPQKRIESIAKLEPTNSQDKQVLHELAFNDEDKNVSLAALEKLASFALWQKMAQIARDPYVKREAQRFVNETILGHNNYPLSNKERTAYLLESANNELRSQFLTLNPHQQSDDVTLKLLEKLNNASFTLKFINQYASSTLQQNWLKTADDKKILQKLKNKTTDPKFAEIISQRLDELKTEEEKPVQLIQQATFVLSKLQALADSGDYEKITKKSRLLKEEFNELSKGFSLLPADKKLEIETKFDRINNKVETVLERLFPEWERAQFKLEQERRMTSLARLTRDLNELTDALLTVDDAELQSTVQEVDSKRNQLYQEVQQAEAFSPDFPQKGFIAAADRATDTVANLKTLRSEVNRIRDIVNESEALFHSKETTFEVKSQKQQELKAAWLKSSKSLPTMPNDLADRWQEISKRWKKQIDDNESKQIDLTKTCHQQMSAIENLISKGKFNAAIAKFSKLEANFASLSSSKQTSLTYKFEKVRESVERLEGWKDYLATPRRPELIEQVKRLLSEPVGSIKERAEKVKYLRKQWQSLGALSSKSELALEFDELIEQAFSPCRKHYQEQEERREKTKRTRQALIDEAASLDVETDIESLASQYEKLTASWHKEDRLDSDTWRKMKRQWSDAIKSTSQRVNEWYQENQRRKQKLIEQVKTQLDEEDVQTAVEFAKQAQAKWKTLGYAGKKEENRLWRSFRAANDEIFARLKDSERQAKEQYNQEKERFLSEIQSINDDFLQHQDTSDSEAIEDLETRINASAMRNDKTVKNALSRLVQIKKLHEQRKKNIAKQHQYDALLTAIPVFHNSDTPESKLPNEVWEKLDKKQQGWFVNVNEPGKNDRAYLTTKLEWITGIDSPEEAQNERNQINLEQLAEKMEQNRVADFETVLGQWVGCGPLADFENELFERLARCVHKQIADLETTAP